MQYIFLLINLFSNLYLVFLLGLVTNRAHAQQIHPTNPERTPINHVQELSDVHPTDWAYSALQNLIQVYGYPQGYEDYSFRGNLALSRYEFASALNRFFEKIVEPGKSTFAQDDLITLRRLQKDFASELEAVRAKINQLNNRIGAVENNQFSTTTKLNGQVIFATTAAFGMENNIEENLTLSGRVRLFFNTSFTGQDLLRVRLLAGNIQNLQSATGTNMARLSFDSNTNNQFKLDQLLYQFPLGNNARLTIISVGTIFSVVNPINPLLGNDGQGSPFLFGIRSPIYREEIGGTGIGISYDISDQFNLSAVYLATDAESPTSGSGLFNGAFSALSQLTWQPSSSGKIALAYSRSFNAIDINAGGLNTNAPFGEESDSISADSYGLITTWQLSSKVSIGGWAGWVRAQAQDLADKPTAEILYYAATLAISDLAQEGDLAGLVLGQPPRLIDNEFPGIDDPDPAFNLELFYRLPASKGISITPGLLVIFNPEHNNNNDTIYVGTIRTTFSF